MEEAFSSTLQPNITIIFTHTHRSLTLKITNHAQEITKNFMKAKRKMLKFLPLKLDPHILLQENSRISHFSLFLKDLTPLSISFRIVS
jgi:hypothetical protein